MPLKKENRRWSVEKRLEFIDFRLFWEGAINRSDIMDRFGVSVPQASNDLSAYQELAPKNLEYDHRERKYFASRSFKPRFIEPDSDVFLFQFRDDVIQAGDQESHWLSMLLPHDIVRMPRRNIKPSILKSIFSAIRHNQKIDINYQSMSSDGPRWRAISPHAFAFDGMRWHARAFCENDRIFKDFLLSRVLETGKSDNSTISPTNDAVWNSYFTLILKPHPRLTDSQADAVATDYGMADRTLHIKMRLSLLYYYLRRLGLPDADGENSNPREQHVVVANKDETKLALRTAQQNNVKEEA